MNIEINDSNFHEHIVRRMEQRGITKEEIKITLARGWNAGDATEGTKGKVYVFEYNAVWQSKTYPEKEVTVIIK